VLEFFGQRALAATYRAHQVKDLFLFFQTLGRVAEIRYDLLDGIFHPKKVFEGRVNLDLLIREDSAQGRILPGVEYFRLPDGIQYPFCWLGIYLRVFLALLKIGSYCHLIHGGTVIGLDLF
jgi:hypothetical protein